MPIIRRDDSSDPFDPYIFLIWKQKWLILGVSLLTGILVFFGLYFVPSTFQANAEIFVNRLSSLPSGETPNPETVDSLLKNRAVIEKVRNDYVKKFNLDHGPKIEDFAKQFDVKTTILQDTTVRKEISPVLTLQVEAKGAMETRFILESWIRNFIADFGNYTAQEAVMKKQAYMTEKQNLETEIVRLEKLQSEADSKIPYLRKILAEKLDLLSPSKLTFRDPDADNSKISLDLSMKGPRMMPGLLERYNESVLRTRAGDLPSSGDRELIAITASIKDAETSVTEAEENLSAGLYDQTVNQRQLGMLRGNQAAINEALSRFSVASAVYQDVVTSGELPAGGDIRTLSMPVMPEARVWPKRSISAVVAVVAAAILTIFFIIARNFLTKNSLRLHQ